MAVVYVTNNSITLREWRDPFDSDIDAKNIFLVSGLVKMRSKQWLHRTIMTQQALFNLKMTEYISFAIA